MQSVFQYTSTHKDFYMADMKRTATISAVLHLAAFVLATIGLPSMVVPPEPVETSISVELVNVAEIAQTPEPEDIQQPAQKPPKPVYNRSEVAPDLLSPQEPDVEPVPNSPPEKPKIPDLTDIAAPPKPRTKPKPPTPKAEPKQDEQEDISSLLKSLTPDQPKEQKPKPTPVQETPKPQQIPDYSKQMTMSELDSLNRGVQPCWNVNAGGKNAEDLIVELRVFVNPDRRVRDVQIKDQIRYNTDSHFRAAADAARRSLLNPRCSTLQLPPEKYESWKSFIYIFDPSQML